MYEIGFFNAETDRFAQEVIGGFNSRLHGAAAAVKRNADENRTKFPKWLWARQGEMKTQPSPAPNQ